MISDEAVEAAAKALAGARHGLWELTPEPKRRLYMRDARLSLEAASPILLSHERQQTADAHRDAIVNRDTADKMETQLARVNALAADWEARGERDIADSKTFEDEDIAMAFLTEGANKVEAARHLRNALNTNPYRSQT
jgi:hypothetical protein